ncbi:peptidoglycan DD-metalloendopeptidase family protein [Neorhizobium petrolearium]|uniref:M23 family metallopeptidase n=1 Tax=Neorhizobium petrolearium TaxID=515361 RepID=UPI003F18BAAC
MTMLVLLMLFICIVIPLGFAWRLWKLDEPSRLGWLIVLADSLVFMALILILGRWDMVGLWTRIAVMGLIAAAALVSLRRHARRPWGTTEGRQFWRRHMPTLASLSLFGMGLTYVVAVGLLGRHGPQPLAFPLEGGRFVVAQGGGIGLLNHHSDHRAQRHALDLTAVNTAGFRVAGLLPDDPARYAIFGKTVISPCDGTVIAARDGLPDLPPATRDRDNPAGNHVVLSCGDLRVELAHLRHGSVAVASGAQVLAGELIGEVGNSGNTTEPHLHIHAVDALTGAGVQMSFDGLVAVRNTVFQR